MTNQLTIRTIEALAALIYELQRRGVAYSAEEEGGTFIITITGV